MAKPRDRIVLWKRTSEFLSIGSKIIGQGCCQWLSFSTTTLKMPVPVILCLSLIASSTHKFCLKKTLTPAQNLALLMN